MKKLVITACYLFFTSCSLSQERNIEDILNKTLGYRGLTRQDITIPVEFFTAAEKSPTNDAKRILPLVKDMMVNPLRSMTWLDSAGEYDKMGIYILTAKMFDMIGYKMSIIEGIDIEMGFKDLEAVANYLRAELERRRNLRKEFFNKLPVNDRRFLEENILSIIEEDSEDDPDEKDIFSYNKRRDESIFTSKKVMDILSSMFDPEVKQDSLHSLRNSSFSDLDIVYMYGYISQFLRDPEDAYEVNNKYVQGRFYYYSDKNGIRIAIGGPGRNIYTGTFDYIFDQGGDDIYNIEIPKNKKENLGGFSCIVDISGNDYYTTSGDFALAGGLFSSSFIFDKEGDDIYESKGAGNLGAAIGGLGLLYDEKGNDTYKGISFSIGAGCFGVGLLVDREGNDFYIANSYSQGFGMTEGAGAIIDNKGNDSYLVDSRSLDVGRYNDHYVSMCQGYGLGLRPYYAGGIGLIIEGAGNDIYNTDIFGQGGAYWYSLGAIIDKSGHDKYNGYQYSQGAGIHLAVGLLKDSDGWDFYQSNGVSQGCGHDFGFGMLWDVKGNDNYSAYSLSQGAGNADGIGILIDESGVDGYLNKYPGNTRGYGNPRREFGSIGVFLDASGEDFYSQPGYDSTFINSSNWGVFSDYYYTDIPSQISGDNFKVQVDSVDRPHDIPFTLEQYFIMAKTIEPRFSYWQEYGFRKLIEDSITTAGYVLTKLGTEDHREVQVMRVLSQKIQKSVSDALMKRLSDYLAGITPMTQAEVSFACYIFGETRNPQGKEILLKLTYDDNYRVRSSAINALGKIKYDTTETGFINSAVSRLIELAEEGSDKKLYNKDIAFALGNYKTPDSFHALMKLLYNPYYGARFTAAENMKGSPWLMGLLLAVDSRFPAIPNEEIPLLAFMQALVSVSDNDFKSFAGFIKMLPEYNADAVKINLMELIMLRRGKATEPGFSGWCDAELRELQSYIKLKIPERQH